MAKEAEKSNGSGLERTLWLAADKLGKDIDAAEYRRVALGLILVKYMCDWFGALGNKLIEGNGGCKGGDREDGDEYTAENGFFGAGPGRWSLLVTDFSASFGGC